MRVPKYLVILLCPLAIGLTWWLGTRDKDFLTPPPGIAIPEIPQTTETPASSPSKPAAKEEAPVTLDTFADQAAMGSAHLIQLAQSLENAKFHHLAWLAWERVLDATSASPADISQARSAIRRLRALPMESTVQFPATPFPITLQAGTARKHVDSLRPALEETARQLEAASCGILRVRTVITGGENPANGSLSPVALWITGPDSGSRSSEVLSFTLQPGTDPKKQIESSVSELLRPLIARSLAPPPPCPADTPFPDQLTDSITRRAWLSLGTLLNSPIEENP